MRLPFVSAIKTSPLEGVQEHSEKIKECTWAFQQAMECYTLDKCLKFEEHKAEVLKLEEEANIIKRRISGHIPKGAVLPVSKFQLFIYLKEQDKILSSVSRALKWLSYNADTKMPDNLQKDFLLLLDAVIEPIEELSDMVLEARKYFKKQNNRNRDTVKKIISEIREMKNNVDLIEDRFKLSIFKSVKEPIMLFHLIKLSEIVGSISAHSENAGDIMRAMIAKP